MKKLIFILLPLLIFSSCVTKRIIERNYYMVYLDEDTKFYSKSDSLSKTYATLKEGTTIYIDLENPTKGYTYVRYGNVNGWMYRPGYRSTPYRRETGSSTDVGSVTGPARSSSVISSSTNTGGTVQVKGYYRKDGTYVKPHTRKAPKRK